MAAGARHHRLVAALVAMLPVVAAAAGGDVAAAARAYDSDVVWGEPRRLDDSKNGTQTQAPTTKAPTLSTGPGPLFGKVALMVSISTFLTLVISLSLLDRYLDRRRRMKVQAA